MRVLRDVYASLALSDAMLLFVTAVCDTPLHRLDAHQAAVKALAWCPWQKNLLASGGGTADRMIRFWNSSSGTCLNEVDTHSQVCALQWSQHDKELVSSHGYSHNQYALRKLLHCSARAPLRA